MERKKIYFVQTGCVFNNEYFLPYATGIIASFAFSNETIKKHYTLADIFYKCDNIEDVLQQITEPGVVAFSCYMWNYKFNLKLASAIKELFPECKIIFGGHQICNTRDWLEEYPFIDFAISGEGEKPFSEILLSLCGNRDFSTIANISFRSNNMTVTNETKSITMNINEIPSPYLTGIFDDILNNSNDKFAAVIETSRGCPYHCAYCDWGDYNLPMRYFDAERVKSEIEYLGKHSVVFVVLADSNFGMRYEDEAIAEKFIEAKNKYGFPKAVEIAFAKHSPERVFSINKRLYENNMSRGATLSMQTLDPLALKNIGRENITKEKFSTLLSLYSENRIPSYTELILGLPGETYESFCNGIEFLLANGQHNSIHVFYCEILPNSLMGTKEYIEKHKIKSIERDFSLRNGINSAGIDGKSHIIVSTETMDAQSFLKSILYAFTIQVFHNFGLLRVVALYYHYEKNMKYMDFYNSFINWLNNSPDTFTGKLYNYFENKYKASLEGYDFETFSKSEFGETQFNLPDGAFLEIVCSLEEFYNDIRAFLHCLDQDSTITEEILEFQKLIIRKPENTSQQANFSFDWIDFYTGLIEGKKTKLKKACLNVSVLESSEYTDLVSYAEAIAIKGRRIGKSIALNDPDGYTFEYIKES